MSKTIIVETGDCLINLSNQEGFFWETVWNHPQNAALRTRRKQYNIIKKGDKVFIPDRTIKEVPRPTEQRHHFVRKGLTVKFSLTLWKLGEPRANEHYILIVDGHSREGYTDANGELTERIPPGAREGLLLLGENRQEFTLDFGYVDPIEEVSGVKSRLRNIGFYDGEIDDELDPDTVAAIAEFQQFAKLAGQGDLDDATRQALVDTHGS